ncbi:hypothetical protein BD414DRAFT_504200 [Trametes punicea]|nr:hypothetical protein BD414DRAFT_504200 [Trametes punicea]
MSAFKRPRSQNNVGGSPSPSRTPSPTLKAARSSATPPPPGAGGPSTSSGRILCTLPPTCNPPNRPTPLSGTRDLEAHYATYHAHVCEEKGCGCVFPDARLLELHQTECHDPLAAVRKERGEKIFACHLASCPRLFSTPKTRRLHLIQAHGYPKEYFFAVTNKGVGGLLKKWGEGASLLRRPWHPRENGTAAADEDDAETGMETEESPREMEVPKQDEDEDEDKILVEKIPIDRPAAGPSGSANGQTGTSTRHTTNAKDVDTLANAMDSLSLVPASVRFGRGRAGRAASHSLGQVRHGSAGRDNGARGGPMELDHVMPHVRGRGRGGHPIPRGRIVRGVALGRGVGRGMGPGRGVSKESAKA